MFKIEMIAFGEVKTVKGTWLSDKEFQTFKTEAQARKKIENMYRYIDYSICRTAKIVKSS